MKKCPFCHADIEENARFCVFCMSSLQEKEKFENQVDINKRWPYIIAALLFVILVFVASIIILSKNDANNSSSLPYDSSEMDLSSQNYIIGDFIENADNDNTNSGNTETTENTTTQVGTGNEENGNGNNNSTASPVSSSSEQGSLSSQQNSSNVGITSSGSNVNSLTSQTNPSSSQPNASSSQTNSYSSQTNPSSSQTAPSKPQTTTSSSHTNTSSSQISPSGSQTNNSSSQISSTGSQSTPQKPQENNSSTTQSETTSPPAKTEATYIYRDAVAADCYTPTNIPAQPISDVIVITGVRTPASDGVYNIPETIDGKRVGAIMPNAFCDSAISATVKKVVIPTTVKTIWKNAFSNCHNLTDIYLFGKTIDIIEEAFANVSDRNGSLKIHCAYDCKTFAFYYYRNIADRYHATYHEWNGGDIE